MASKVAPRRLRLEPFADTRRTYGGATPSEGGPACQARGVKHPQPPAIHDRSLLPGPRQPYSLTQNPGHGPRHSIARTQRSSSQMEPSGRTFSPTKLTA
eukprot:scaffold3911_cov212-Pinguiococcus_pyrenoidosus.AAC.1